MIDFQIALRAKLPFIGVHTDDPVNFKAVLKTLSGKTIMPLPTTKSAPIGDGYLWWTEKLEQVTTDVYRQLCEASASCVVVNAAPSTLVYDAGILPTPNAFYEGYLDKMVEADMMPAMVQVLKGLSVKGAQEVVQLTMARTGSLAPKEIRKTRQMMSGGAPGLENLDTDYDFYEWPQELKDWVDLNEPYFVAMNTPPQLVPRGLLLEGAPGTGKSMFATVLAKRLDVPLFRLDVATTLNRWLGESESRVARNLSIIEQNAPCVWLLDEAEKLFGSNGEEGTTRRLLSQMLWWLQYRKSRVLTIITTNDFAALPKELYRAERLDKVIRIDKLPLSNAKLFASRVFQSVLNMPPSPKQLKVIRDAIDQQNQSTFAHAEVRATVYDLIKTQKWVGL